MERMRCRAMLCLVDAVRSGPKIFEGPDIDPATYAATRFSVAAWLLPTILNIFPTWNL